MSNAKRELMGTYGRLGMLAQQEKKWETAASWYQHSIDLLDRMSASDHNRIQAIHHRGILIDNLNIVRDAMSNSLKPAIAQPATYRQQTIVGNRQPTTEMEKIGRTVTPELKLSVETIHQAVKNERERILKRLTSELAKLELLRDQIRDGKSKLDGEEGKKSQREQLEIVAKTIKEAEKKIVDANSTNPFPPFMFGNLKVGDFGYFGYDDNDFVVQKIFNATEFAATHQYTVMAIVGGVPHPEGEREVRATSSRVSKPKAW